MCQFTETKILNMDEPASYSHMPFMSSISLFERSWAVSLFTYKKNDKSKKKIWPTLCIPLHHFPRGLCNPFLVLSLPVRLILTPSLETKRIDLNAYFSFFFSYIPSERIYTLHIPWKMGGKWVFAAEQYIPPGSSFSAFLPDSQERHLHDLLHKWCYTRALG